VLLRFQRIYERFEGDTSDLAAIYACRRPVARDGKLTTATLLPFEEGGEGVLKWEGSTAKSLLRSYVPRCS
jgi:hypothetical protein